MKAGVNGIVQHARLQLYALCTLPTLSFRLGPSVMDVVDTGVGSAGVGAAWATRRTRSGEALEAPTYPSVDREGLDVLWLCAARLVDWSSECAWCTRRHGSAEHWLCVRLYDGRCDGSVVFRCKVQPRSREDGATDEPARAFVQVAPFASLT